MKSFIKRINHLLQKYLKKLRFEKRYWLYNRSVEKLIIKYALPPLTEIEKKDIDNYWGKYGVKFSNYNYHRLFYGITKKKDPRFIPFPFAALVLYPFYNDSTKIQAYADKNMFYKLLPNMPFPKLIGQRINGRFFDSEGKYYGEIATNEFLEQLFQTIVRENNEEIIIKEASDTSRGLGVKKFIIKTPQMLKEVLKSFSSDNFVIQFAIQQHQFFDQFNKDSVNIIRITTWRKEDKVHIFSPCIRFGIRGHATDVAFVNGVEVTNGIGIDISSGIIFDTGIDLQGNKFSVDVKNRQVPCWEKIVNLVCRNHLTMHYFDIIAWDITVDINSNIICIEYNIKCPGIRLYQLAHGPLAGEHTDEFLEFLLNTDLQKKLLPWQIRK